jgi:hypothetical protein
MTTTTDQPALQPDTAAIAAQAQQAERARCATLLALKTKMPAHAALIDTMIADGTPIDQANARVIDAEAAARPGRETLDTLRDLGAASRVPASLDQLQAQLAHLPLDARCQKLWEQSAELQAEFRGNFADYKAYEGAVASGRVKVYRRKEDLAAA